MKTAEQILVMIASQSNHVVSESVFYDALKIEHHGAQGRILDGLVDSGKLIYIPLLAGTSGSGSYCLSDCPELPKYRRMHAEWNAKHPELAARWPTARKFAGS